MNRIQRGRGGWVAESGLARAAIVALVVVALAIGGCSTKKKPGEGEGANPNGTGMNDQNLNGSSLKGLQNGTLGANGQGPLGDIHFDYNEATIRSQDNEVLKANADYLSSHAQARVQIEGHCDDRGSEEYNIALGARRAQAAKDYLATLGIASDRMSTISYGKELPVCSESDEQCYEQNWRDHFAVSQ